MAEEKMTLIDMDSAVREACEAMNLKHYKSWNFDEERNSGFPSWCIIKEGRIFYIELKCGRDPVKREQGEWLVELRHAGAHVYIVRGRENLDCLTDLIFLHYDEPAFFRRSRRLKDATLKELGTHGID